MRVLATLMALSLWSCCIEVFAVTEEAQGTVYADGNGNGVRDPGEDGIENVLVSNGNDVVATDRHGTYSIPVTDDTIIFVIKPAGWMTPVGPNDTVPRFYYIHKPNGSPVMQYAGVAPTGPLPASVDFPLHRQKERDTFRVICLGDTQVRNVEEVRFLAHDIIEDIDVGDAVFGMTLGDNVFNDLSVFEPLVETMNAFRIPWRYVPGNHDHNHDAPTVETTDDTFERVFGPSYYAFNYGRVHFIVLNDIGHEAGKDQYNGRLGERQRAFVANDLRYVNPKQLIVLLMHIPIMTLADSKELYELLRGFPHTFSLSAHTHDQQNLFVDQAAGWPQETAHHHLIQATACGSWWGGNFGDEGIPVTPMSDGGPNGYSIITFDGDEYAVEFRAARRSPEHQMNIWLPEGIPAAETGKASAIVNVFAGSERSRVEMQLDGTGEWTALEQFTGKDPHYLETIGRQSAFLKILADSRGVQEVTDEFKRNVRTEFRPVLRGLPEPVDTAHLWRGALPEGLKPGVHTLDVRTTDMYGHEYAGRRVFTVH